MPTSLTATKIKDTYGQVLHVDGGVTSTPKTVYDGDGTATALKVSTTGAVVDGETTVNSGLTIGRTAVTSPAASDGNVFSGTYTPTLTNGTNITSSTAYPCQYMRVGNVVTVTGSVSITPTAAGTALIDISLPIISAFTVSRQASGFISYNASTVAHSGYGSIYSESTNDRLQTRFNAGVGGTDQEWHFTATYQVI